MFEGLTRPSPSTVPCLRQHSPAAFWLVLVPLWHPQALDLLLDRLKRAGLNFSHVRALSGGGQVGGASATASNTFVTKVTAAQFLRSDHPGRWALVCAVCVFLPVSMWVLLGTLSRWPCSGDLWDWLHRPHTLLTVRKWINLYLSTSPWYLQDLYIFYIYITFFNITIFCWLQFFQHFQTHF